MGGYVHNLLFWGGVGGKAPRRSPQFRTRLSVLREIFMPMI